MAVELPNRFEELAAFVRAHEVGRGASLTTPFGARRLTYADLTATGRYLHFVEAWIRRLRPYYANTHTTISSTGRLMTELREEARAVIRRGVGAGPDDEVLFVGAGATAAVNKLVGLLGLRALRPPEERPLVLVGPLEHHSNQLPWLESWAEVDEVELGTDGLPDLADLAEKLARARGRRLLIGAFTAASNVTGVLCDVRAIARLLHAHGALAVFDYAAAGPYVPIDMHPADDPAAGIDALFVSTHKFVGGPQASGVLVAHRGLFRGDAPERPGGGTVTYVGAVSRDRVDYSADLVTREEGGTPAIIGDVRAGTAFLVKELLGPADILAHEIALARAAVERLAAHPRIDVLGPRATPRLAILSFNVRGLHHDLVSTLLDQLFGIQNRSGCSCAGPYGHRLLGLDAAASERVRALVRRGFDGVRPGWVRVTLPSYASPADVEFILSAIELVADLGEAFVPSYRFDWRSGAWHHIAHPAPLEPPIALTLADLTTAAATYSGSREADRAFPRAARAAKGEASDFGASEGDDEIALDEGDLAAERARYLAEARALGEALAASALRESPRWNPASGDDEVDAAVWFRFVHATTLS